MSAQDRRIVITGFMCAGKTTLAKALAERLNCRMIDLDYLITERERRTVPDLLSEGGEERFRESEARALRVVLEMKRARVIALGGGAWMRAENRALINANDCFTIWLDAPFELCWRRITVSEEERPLARDRETAERLYRERRPVYQLAAQRISATEEKSPEDLVAELMAAL
jgi:shikimate kinase